MRLNIDPEGLTDVFVALSHPDRRAIIERLSSGGEATVSDLAVGFDVSFNQVSKHLKTLERAGLLIKRKEGREYYCRLDMRPLFQAKTWIETYEKFWKASLEGLAEYLDNI